MQIHALQSQLERHEVHAKQVHQLRDSQSGIDKAEGAKIVNSANSQDVAADLEQLRRQEVEYKQQLQTFIQEYKKRGLSQ